MPTKPCTGVENYNQPPCPGESIWNEGQAILDAVDPKDPLLGMAINPVSRRGQHQVGFTSL
jgi:hypothetical protein